LSEATLIWQPKKNGATAMGDFRQFINTKYGLALSDYDQLHIWSVSRSEDFWNSLFDYYPIQYSGERERVCLDHSFEKYAWFPDVQLNFAQNLLAQGKDADQALIFSHESGKSDVVTYAQLRWRVGQWQRHLAQFLQAGDTLAAFMPNIPETVVAMLACTAQGAIFTSTSCDFGEEGVVDRFGQCRPKVLVAATHYQYNGKTFDLRPRLQAIVKRLPSLKHVILVDFLQLAGGQCEAFSVPSIWHQELEAGPVCQPLYHSLPFNHPLYIMYSSGTTGKPKCIVHCAGGVLLQHLKEIGLHTGFHSIKCLFFYTTCGWMMWNWLVSGLFFGGKIVLYEGSPSYPSMADFLSLINRWQINFFGTGPKFLRALEDSQLVKSKPFTSLEMLLSTGAPLLPEQYDFVAQKFAPGVPIASISGGTDIIGCFMLGNPELPVYRGEIQCLGLGMDVVALDDNGQVVVAREGELVCRRSFPSRPLGFLGDDNGAKFREAYFSRYPGVWYHGDFITITERHSVKVFGRSDATLNPGGVRIGTSEIYRQIEGLPYVMDSLCVGRQVQGDVEVVLFVKMSAGESLSQLRCEEIKARIKAGTTPRHVPKMLIAVRDIPYTRSGKKMELAVYRLLHGKALTNLEAVANPECLDEYRGYAV
jgi:acetoacetyl-CoA synthetase